MFEAAKKRMEERQKEQAERQKRKAERAKSKAELRKAKKELNKRVWAQAREKAGKYASGDEVQRIFEELRNNNSLTN
jgi:F0F1-type ATP synthase membrane subunit b/b'